MDMLNAKISFLLFFSCTICLSSQIKSPNVHSNGVQNNVVQMKQDNAVDTERITKRDNIHSRQRRSFGQVGQPESETDQKCQKQEIAFKDKLSQLNDDFAYMYFFNETKSNMALVWVGQKVLVAVTEEEMDYKFELIISPSNLYRSDKQGKVFDDITKNIDNGNIVKIKKMNGLQKNGNQLFVVLHGENHDETTLKISNDEGDTFYESTMPFSFNGRLNFHPTKAEYILAYDDTTMNLYISTDTGKSWKSIKEKCITFRWTSWEKDPSDTIYVSSDPDMTKQSFFFWPSGHTILEKSINGGQNWKTIHDDIKSFGLQDKFIYASVKAEADGERYMEVSTDGGNSWDEVQLPSITEERFYSILDMSEGQIFMHVDDPGDTGVGTIYTSDASGIIFSESLKNHLFPNFEDVTDFYKVNSMRGVYICSQLDVNASIHTLISRDRGAVWSRIRRPSGVPCVDEGKECYLQIHNRYSAQRGVKSPPPKSTDSATGIILVHGHIASSLQVTDPDLYVSDDGGYKWRLALKGPHYNEIADQGGLLVAIPEVDHPQVLKFSTDEGNCWHEYKFTNENITFTGLLTEPGNQAMSVAIWAYGSVDKQWRVYVIDFEKVIDAKCVDTDYIEWMPHSDNTNDGCLLGTKEIFQRLRQDSWCLNGHAQQLSATKRTEVCPCTKDDYDCDYGYLREAGTDRCIADNTFKSMKLDICKRGFLEELVYEGYHKIPGDRCSNDNGFQPATDSIIKLKDRCKEGSTNILMKEEGYETPKPVGPTKRGRAVLVITVLSVFAVLAVLVVFLVKKYKHLRQSKLVYRYSMISSDDQPGDDLEHALGTSNSLYEDSSDEENAQTSNTIGPMSSRINQSSSQPAQLLKHASSVPNGSVTVSSLPHKPVTISPPHRPATKSSPPRQPPVTSYHDDSDEDMLE